MSFTGNVKAIDVVLPRGQKKRSLVEVTYLENSSQFQLTRLRLLDR